MLIDFLTASYMVKLLRQDAETGQTVLGGMGELHLDIVVDRSQTSSKTHDPDTGSSRDFKYL